MTVIRCLILFLFLTIIISFLVMFSLVDNCCYVNQICLFHLVSVIVSSVPNIKIVSSVSRLKKMQLYPLLTDNSSFWMKIPDRNVFVIVVYSV